MENIEGNIFHVLKGDKDPITGKCSTLFYFVEYDNGEVF